MKRLASPTMLFLLVLLITRGASGQEASRHEAQNAGPPPAIKLQEIPLELDSGDWKPGDPMPVYVIPFYNSRGPTVDVGEFSKPLASAKRGTIHGVAAVMKEKWDTLPIEAMYVVAIRLYDLGRKDEAVYWFYSSQYRAWLFQSLLSESENPRNIGAPAFEAGCAHAAFDELAGEYINGYAGGNVEKWKSAIKAAQSEGKKTLPKFMLIYPAVRFIPTDRWADKNKEGAGELSKLLNFIETQGDELKVQRKKNGIEGKY